ncbi:hypothetical protein BDZ97DRAFT_782737 [Flammula alnicola]|nr:hypothetical protein BDZ97DRAFT_782737 [Flammula alnicola]
MQSESLEIRRTTMPKASLPTRKVMIISPTPQTKGRLRSSLRPLGPRLPRPLPAPWTRAAARLQTPKADVLSNPKSPQDPRSPRPLRSILKVRNAGLVPGSKTDCTSHKSTRPIGPRSPSPPVKMPGTAPLLRKVPSSANSTRPWNTRLVRGKSMSLPQVNLTNQSPQPLPKTHDLNERNQ